MKRTRKGLRSMGLRVIFVLASLALVAVVPWATQHNYHTTSIIQKQTTVYANISAKPLIKTITTQKYTNDDTSYNNSNIDTRPMKPTLVVLLSSAPRSGSSFIAELMATHNSTVLFFEPLHKIQHDPCMETDDCVANYLKDKLLCKIDKQFENWLVRKALFLGFFNNRALKCAEKVKKGQQTCLKSINITAECNNSKHILLKVIRARLGQLRSLLNDTNLNLKIIHLHRDPRGFIKSIRKFQNWNSNSASLCSGLEKDMLSYVVFSKMYPNKMMQVSYERFSRDPYTQTEALFRHAYGSSVLSQATLEYLKSHTREDPVISKHVMTRTRDSTRIYQEWRDTISASLLRNIEGTLACRSAINMMGHTLFETVDNVKNKSISLFMKY